MVNGKREPAAGGTYAVVKRTWKDGDRIELTLPMDLHLSRMPDDSSLAAIMYGPVVLAGALGMEAMTAEMQRGSGYPDVERMFTEGAAVQVPVLVPPSGILKEWIEPVPGESLTFRTVNAGKPREALLVPFYRLFGQRYAIYWEFSSPAQWKLHTTSRTSLPDGVVDRVTVGDKSSEREHNFQAYRSSRGETQGRSWVRSSLWFRYDMNVAAGRPMTLRCTYSGDEKECSFDVLIDGVLLATETLQGERPGEFLALSSPVPPGLLQGKNRVAVMFRGKAEKPTAQVYECSFVGSAR
jgi:hypothetical protein